MTAHSLSLLTGVEIKPIKAPFRCKAVEWCDDNQLPSYPITKRITLYRSSVPALDEGWTRFVLENNGRDVRSLRDAEVRAGNLNARFDSIVIPDQAARTIFGGYRAGAMPPELTGGLGNEGVKALREFVEAGGTLVFLNRASDFAIQQFKLPLRDVVAGLSKADFYVPGSILRLQLDSSHPIAQAMAKETIAWAEESPVFEVADVAGATVPASDVKVVAWYPANQNPLLSGWLLGAEQIKGKAALVEVKMGKGHVILFGFRPQYRAQSWATYPLFFNALNR